MRDPVSENPERRRQARLLSTFLLLMLAVFAATDLLSSLSQPGSVIPWYGYAFVLSALLLNRAGYYPPAAFLTLSMFPLATFGVVLGGADPRIVFSYLIIGVIASSIFLDRRSAIAFDVACFTFLLLTPLFIPTSVPSVRTIRGALVLVAIGSGLSILLMIHRDELERDRQEALRASDICGTDASLARCARRCGSSGSAGRDRSRHFGAGAVTFSGVLGSTAFALGSAFGASPVARKATPRAEWASASPGDSSAPFFKAAFSALNRSNSA